MHPRPILSGIIVSAALVLSACATDNTTGSATTSVDDATLNNNVTYAVHGVPGIESSDLDVSTRRGVVTLSGRTDTRAQAQDAIEAARHVPGVRTVDYDINVDEQ